MFVFKLFIFLLGNFIGKCFITLTFICIFVLWSTSQLYLLPICKKKSNIFISYFSIIIMLIKILHITFHVIHCQLRHFTNKTIKKSMSYFQQRNNKRNVWSRVADPGRVDPDSESSFEEIRIPNRCRSSRKKTDWIRISPS